MSCQHSVNAQYVFSNDSLFKAGQENTGRLWGYAFGDFDYKTHADSLTRGNANQYTGIPADKTQFAFRRIYLGYDYNITKKFTAELLLAAEDNFPAEALPAMAHLTSTVTAGNSTGDLTSNQKLTFYIKNMRYSLERCLERNGPSDWPVFYTGFPADFGKSLELPFN